MKSLIFVLTILASSQAFAAAQPNYACKASHTDELGNVMELAFDQESGGIGEAYIINQTPRGTLKNNVLKFESVTGDTTLKIKVKETDGTSKVRTLNQKKIRTFKAQFAVDMDGEKMLFKGSCLESLKK